MARGAARLLRRRLALAEERSEPGSLVTVERDRRLRSGSIRAEILPDTEPHVPFLLTVAEIARNAEKPAFAVWDRWMWPEELCELQPLGRSTPGAVPKLLLHHRAARAARLRGDFFVRPRILSLALAKTSLDRDPSRLLRSEEPAVDQSHTSGLAILCPAVRDAPIERHALLAERPGVIGVARDPIDLLAFAQEVLVDGALGRVLVAIPGPRRSAGKEQRQHERYGDDAGPGHTQTSR
jgi:hypothetical protein